VDNLIAIAAEDLLSTDRTRFFAVRIFSVRERCRAYLEQVL
jgi:hypothetical protein